MNAQRLLAGTYSMQDEIGKGGMGVVYRGRDEVLEKDVAIKELNEKYSSDPKVAEWFRGEARMLFDLMHPNIVRFLAYKREFRNDYIVMELVRGQDLQSIIRQEGQLPFETVIDYSLQIAEALTHAFRQQIMHRDIKPSNILVSDDGQIKVVDFGIGATLDPSAIPQQDILAGTPQFMPPERARHERGDQRSDLYSLGILMIEMLTGRTPYRGMGVDEITRALKNDQTQTPLCFPPPDVPPDLQDIVKSLVRKRPEDRIQTPDELRGRLQKLKLGGGDATMTRPIGPGPPPPLEAQDRAYWKKVVISLVVAILGAVLGKFIYEELPRYADPPTITITAPNSPVYGPATLSVEVVDSQKWYTRLLHVIGSAPPNPPVTVQFFLRSKEIGPILTGPYKMTWDFSTTEPGQHELIAQARGADSTVSKDKLLVTVEDRTPPKITITAPNDRSIFSGSTLTVSANATDNHRVAGVQFHVDGKDIHQEVTQPPYSIRWKPKTLRPGNHRLTATVRDAAGLPTTSKAIVVVRRKPPGPPGPTGPTGHPLPPPELNSYLTEVSNAYEDFDFGYLSKKTQMSNTRDQYLSEKSGTYKKIRVSYKITEMEEARATVNLLMEPLVDDHGKRIPEGMRAKEEINAKVIRDGTRWVLQW